MSNVTALELFFDNESFLFLDLGVLLRRHVSLT
jgi:hypothetical protein